MEEESEFPDYFVLSLPLSINPSDFTKTERCLQTGARAPKARLNETRLNGWISAAFANPLNPNLNRVCAEVASKYYVEYAKSKGKRCIITAIVPQNSFCFQEMFRTGAGTAYYYEYSFRGGRYLFILKSTQQTKQLEMQET